MPSSSRTEDSNFCVLILSSSSWSFYDYVLVLVLVLIKIGHCPHEDIWTGLTGTFYEDFDYNRNNWLSMILLQSMLTSALLVFRLLTVLPRTNCPREDRMRCPHPRPHGLFQSTVLVLVLVLMNFKSPHPRPRGHWAVLVPMSGQPIKITSQSRGLEPPQSYLHVMGPGCYPHCDLAHCTYF